MIWDDDNDSTIDRRVKKPKLERKPTSKSEPLPAEVMASTGKRLATE